MMHMQKSQQEPASGAPQDYQQQKAREDKAEDVELQEPCNRSPGRKWQLCPVGAGTSPVIDCSLWYCPRQRGRREIPYLLLCCLKYLQLTSHGLGPVGSQETL